MATTYESNCPTQCRVVSNLGIACDLDTDAPRMPGAAWSQLVDTAESHEWSDLHSDRYMFFDDIAAGIACPKDHTPPFHYQPTSQAAKEPTQEQWDQLAAKEPTQEQWDQLAALSASIAQKSPCILKGVPSGADVLRAAEYVGHPGEAHVDYFSLVPDEDIAEEIVSDGTAAFTSLDAAQLQHEEFAIDDDEHKEAISWRASPTTPNKVTQTPPLWQPSHPLDVAALLKLSMTPSQRAMQAAAFSTHTLLPAGHKSLDGETTKDAVALDKVAAKTAEDAPPAKPPQSARSWSARKAAARRR